MLKVMIAEDDLLMADMLEDVLVEGGYEVCGIARTVEGAVELGEIHTPDLAVLDFRLANGGLGNEIVARLRHKGRMGVLYASGSVGRMSLTSADGDAFLGKPYRPEDIIRGLAIVTEIVNYGQTTMPIPKGLHLLGGSAENNILIGPAGDRHRVIRRLRRQQAALAGFGGFALGEGDLGKILAEAARVCADCLDVPFSKVCRYRPEQNDLLVEAGVGWKEGVVGCVVSRADQTSPQGRAFTTGEPVICGNLNRDSGFVLPSFYVEHGIISTLDVIIKKEGQPYGVLEIDNPVQHDYDQHDIDFLTGFANVLAEAVNTSRRNAALSNAASQMQDMIGERDRLLGTKNELLAEKVVLARELHHRVRNNLQLVYGMLTKQLQGTADEAGKAGLAGIARRVMTLAQVYDHLLGTGLSRTIDFGKYLSSLCSSLQAMENVHCPGVDLTCQCEPMILDLDTVTALGLVISEWISNSYAHAFPDGTGSITISMRQDEAGGVATLISRDDGVGFSERGGSKRHGLGLVKRLIEQVGGSAVLRSDHGTEWTLTFPVPASRPGTVSTLLH